MKKRTLTLAVLLGITTIAQAQPYDLPSAPLGITLSRIAADAGITLSFDPALARDKKAPKIKGNYAPEEALKLAAESAGLELRKSDDGVYRLGRPGAETARSAAADNLSPITVYGDVIALDGLMTDEQGYDAIYDKNYSNDYTGKQRIDTYRGTDPSDLLQSFSGIYSGDARNSGAIDPNIRGLQGEGRIKVRVDGTEQALSVYRGYNGASNRNYIDPLLTSNIRIVKDSGLDTGVHTGVGGGIEINTLGINDIVGADGGFGGEIRLESTSNAVKPRIGKDYDGTLLKDVPGYSINTSSPFTTPYWMPGKSSFAQEHKPKNGGDQYNLFNGKDVAGRVAVGYKGENWDVMAAYAKRNRGNYFSGKHNSEYYAKELPGRGGAGDPVRVLAHRLPPGREVFNTSNNMTSYLFKAGWQPTEEQSLRLNLRRSETTYGEIMPSRQRISSNIDEGVQWPLSTVKLNAYSLQYHLAPVDNRWLDLHANLWRTDTKTHLYNSGGAIRDDDDRGTNLDFSKDFDPIAFQWNLDALKDDILINNAAIDTNHTRKGFDITNRMQLADRLSLTLGGSFQKEKLDSHLKYWPNGGWSQVPRRGKRQEYDLGFNFNWQVNDRFSVDVGAKYASYWIHDDFLADKMKDYDPNDSSYNNYIARQENYVYTYKIKKPVDVEKKRKELIATWATVENFLEDYDTTMSIWTNPKYTAMGWNEPGSFRDPAVWNPNNLPREEWAKVEADKKAEEIKKWEIKDFEEVSGDPIPWPRDEHGRLSRDNNPCLNGTLDKIPNVIPRKYAPDACPGEITTLGTTTTLGSPEVHKVRDHRWVPAIALNYKFSDDARIYARYNESVRFPSSFEGLMGFSGTRGIYPLRPEHSRKFELGYAHNLLRYFPGAEVADVKVAYYQNRVKDVIDRTGLYQFSNLEQQKIRGLELQGRYDNGKFFGDLGISYLMQNDVCDEHTVAMLEAFREGDTSRAKLNRPPFSRCVRDGFYNTFSLTHAIPELSAKLHLGGRFFDRKLEVGSRLTYYNKRNNKDYDNHLWTAGLDPEKSRGGMNVAYGWDKTFLVDAYARYKLNKNFSLELSGSNLTDRYYVDPATRTTVPGPGRTIKFSFTGTF